MRSLLQFSSVAQSCLTLCNPTDCSTPGLPVHHQLLEFTQTHVHWVNDTIQPSDPFVPFSSRLQSFLASGSFQMSQFFASGDQSIGASALASVLPMNTLPNPQHQSYATGNLLSVSVALPILDILHRWNRTVCGLLWWASHTYYSVFRYIYFAAGNCTSFLFIPLYAYTTNPLISLWAFGWILAF